MSEREELIKLLRECKELSDADAMDAEENGQSSEHDYFNSLSGRLSDAISALAAQQEPTEPVAMEGYWWCPNCKAEIGAYHVTYQEYHEDCGHKVEWITPDTAPASGVQERIALQELRNIVNAKRFDVEVFDDDTAFADWAQSRARHAITRAADQVNADQPADAVVVPSDEELSALSLDSWERKYHKVRKEISLITWEEVYKRAYVEGFLAAQEGK